MMGSDLFHEERLRDLGKEIDAVRKAIQFLIDFPPEGHEFRTKDGYPSEMAYNEFAYRRIVDMYRESLQALLDKWEEVAG